MNLAFLFCQELYSCTSFAPQASGEGLKPTLGGWAKSRNGWETSTMLSSMSLAKVGTGHLSKILTACIQPAFGIRPRVSRIHTEERVSSIHTGERVSSIHTGWKIWKGASLA